MRCSRAQGDWPSNRGQHWRYVTLSNKTRILSDRPSARVTGEWKIRDNAQSTEVGDSE